jgi:hypothetical protein
MNIIRPNINLFLLIILCFFTKDLAGQVNIQKANVDNQYTLLLAKFPLEHQGLGLDAAQKPGLTDQPMTFALVLSSEAIRYKTNPNLESKNRIRDASTWLLDNQDLDHDGIPGWGLPLPWDAFSDGSINGPNHVYTITTAIVLNGFLDALEVKGLFSATEQTQIKDLIKRVMLHWCSNLWSTGYGGGYFWYSPSACDNIFSINAPAMYLGSMARYLKAYPEFLSAADYKFIESHADLLAKAILSTVRLRDGCPYWAYEPIPNKFNNREVENDLVHQVYILWGVELYRSCIGHVVFPWNIQHSLQSLRNNWKNDILYGYPQDVKINPKASALWGIGAMIAFEATYGSHEEAKRVVEYLNKAYGPIPDLSLTPRRNGKSSPFYPRQVAHVLWGLSYYYYSNSNSN